MKLGEALNERARLAKRTTDLRDLLDASIIVVEGEEPVADATQVSVDILATIDQIQDMVARINRTNTATNLADGTSLTEALAKRDALGAKISHYEFIIRKLTNQDPYSYRRAASELKSVRLVDTQEVVRIRDNFAQERRTLDAELQALNWATDLLE